MINKILEKLRKFRQDKNLKDLYKGSSGGFLIKAIGALLAFILQITLTRIIGVEEYGIYAYVITWINILIIFSQFGFKTSAVRFVAEYVSKENFEYLKGFILFGKKIIILISLILIALVLTFSIVILQEKGDSLYFSFIISSMLIPLLSILNYYSTIIKGFKKIIKSLYPPLIIKNLSIIFLLIILYQFFNLNIRSYHVFGLIIISILISLSLVYKSYSKLLPNNYEELQPIFKKKLWLHTSRDMMLISGVSLLLFKADTIMVGSLLNTTMAGIYSVSSQLSGFIVFILAAVNAILSPIVSDLYYSNNTKELNRIYQIGVRIVFVISLIIGLVLIIFGKNILNIFDEKFISGYPILVILIIGQLGNAFVGSTGVLLNMTGHQKIALKVLIITVSLNILLNYVLIKSIGVLGAAISTATMNITTNIIFAYIVYKTLNIIPTPFKIG